MKTVLDYQTQEERAASHALLREVQQAQAALAKREKTREEINKKLRDVRAQAPRSKRAALEAFEEGKQAPAPPPGPAEADLKDALDGCEAAILDDKDAVHAAAGALRAKKVEIITSCANRAGSAMVPLAAQLKALWNAIAGASTLLYSVTNAPDAEVVDGDKWRLLYIPASKSLPSLMAAGVDQGDGFHTRCLANEVDTYSKTSSAAADALQRAITASLGAWPFGITANAFNAQHVVNVTAQVERVKQEVRRNESRRAAIAKAAEGMEFPHVIEEV